MENLFINSIGRGLSNKSLFIFIHFIPNYFEPHDTRFFADFSGLNKSEIVVT